MRSEFLRMLRLLRSRYALFAFGCLSITVAVAVARTARPPHHTEQPEVQTSHLPDPQPQQIKAEDAVPDVVREGDALVEAIYRFRSRTGLWPMSLSELGELPLSPRQQLAWEYGWRPSGYWNLQTCRHTPDFAGRFLHTADKGGRWIPCAGSKDLQLSRFPQLNDPVVDRDCVAPVTEKVLRQRIATEPHRPMHHQALVLLLYRLNKRTEALAACRASYKECSEHWWNQLMLAKLEHELHLEQQAGTDQRLLAWARSYNNVPHFVLIAQHYLESGNREEAFRLLRHAATLPVQDIDVIPSTGEVLGKGGTSYLWQAAGIAYRERQYDLLLAVCDHWEQCVKERNYSDHSYLVFRAAGLLAQEKYEAAAAAYNEALTNTGPHMWSNNLDSLQQALTDKNPSFRYYPGDYPPATESLFVPYD
jgi:hypothetical protein